MADLMQIRRRILMETGELPPIYRPVDYLQTYGYKARIGTGVMGDDNTLSIYGDMGFVEYRQYHTVFGNYTSDSANSWRMIHPSAATRTFITLHANGTNNVGPTGLTNFSYTSPFRLAFLIRPGHSEVSINGGGLIVTDVTQTTGTANDREITIGASSPTATEGTHTTRTKWYRFKIWKGTALIRDYVPAVRIKDSKPGFYDMVNSTFSPSVGTVDFTAGNDA